MYVHFTHKALWRGAITSLPAAARADRGAGDHLELPTLRPYVPMNHSHESVLFISSSQASVLQPYEENA